MLGNGYAEMIGSIPDLAHRAYRPEAGADIAAQGTRMVGGAGVDPDRAATLRAQLEAHLRPGRLDGGAEEGLTDAPADQMRHQAEIADVDLAAETAVELEEAARLALVIQHVQMDLGVGQQGRDLRVGRHAAQ